MPFLDDAWRPDRSGILVVLVRDEIPPDYPERVGIKFDLIGDRQQIIAWEPFVTYVAELIRTGVPIFLSVPGKPGYTSGKTFLNDRMLPTAALHDYGRMILELALAVAACESHVGEPIEIS